MLVREPVWANMKPGFNRMKRELERRLSGPRSVPPTHMAAYSHL